MFKFNFFGWNKISHDVISINAWHPNNDNALSQFLSYYCNIHHREGCILKMHWKTKNKRQILCDWERYDEDLFECPILLDFVVKRIKRNRHTGTVRTVVRSWHGKIYKLYSVLTVFCLSFWCVIRGNDWCHGRSDI